MDIEHWRKAIDSIDEKLVEMLNERSKCAIEIGRIKRELGLPVYSPVREAEVIQHVVGLNSGPLEPEAIRRLFERIIDESRSLERVTVEKELAEKERLHQGTGENARASKRRERKR